MELARPASWRGGAIPARHTADGLDVSPGLEWTGVPAGASDLVLIVEDPDAPRPEPWVHWLVYNLSPSLSCVPEGVAKAALPAALGGAMQGENSWGRIGYGGPSPPRGHGVHHYHFRLYALDTELRLLPGVDRSVLLKAMRGHVIAEAKLIGTYSR